MRDLAPHSERKLQQLAAVAGEYVEQVVIRGL